MRTPARSVAAAASPACWAATVISPAASAARLGVAANINAALAIPYKVKLMRFIEYSSQFVRSTIPFPIDHGTIGRCAGNRETSCQPFGPGSARDDLQDRARPNGRDASKPENSKSLQWR